MPSPHRLRHTAEVLISLAVAAVAMLDFPVAEAGTDQVNAAEWPLDGNHFHAQELWRISEGAGVTVAVIDTGVDATHPDLAGQVLSGTGFVGVAGDTGQTDASSDSHGTSIAAIIAGTGKGDHSRGMTGLAPQAKILPIRVAVTGTVAPVSLAKGIFYAVDHHAQIINISEGTADPDPDIRSAVSYALAHDVLVVAAAGNAGQEGNQILYPAAFPGVVSVTGVDDMGRSWADSESGITTTLAAPAVGVYSAATDGQYLTGDGTSYSAPYVAAAAALVWSQHPRFTAGQVIRQLITTADPHGTRPHDDHYGYGTLDPLRALTTPPNTNTSNPLLTPVPSPPNHVPLFTAIGAAAATTVVAVAAVCYFRRRRRAATPKNHRDSPVAAKTSSQRTRR